MSIHSRREDVMAKKVKPIPDGYHTATPYLIVDDGARAIDFYKKAFRAKELMRIPAPENRVGNAEIKIGDSIIMLADEHPAMDAFMRQALQGHAGQHPALRGGRGPSLRPGPRRRRDGGPAGGRPVLRRPLGHDRRPL